MREDIKINDRAELISDQLIEKLEQIYDPEIEVDIYNLGFIYSIQLDNDAHCDITVTFTGIGCECIESVPIEIEAALLQIPEINSVAVHIVWSPAWKITRISRFARIALGINPG
ncbi:metal-sulfur cluster assembly factor [Enterococcus alcedinis]|uniref:MIP18 family-like domain-containing protein n=1 Tax=Enterococcus alcedinis TaxID=1274384 RepID=A0A917JK23_9ENTE|nr:metal-sulfur cluster assembly factor [Enterococcus alcedinis]MBP2103170.1 metal-sulfur cluster biosynthetic enzyme [Enterococcus alcedinis]GGI66734.1 hypothetical protein GCM10011482_23880 [Enterococcus alcedinis]